MPAVTRLLVVGAGTTGRGIAQVAGQSGLDVDLMDVSEATLDGAWNGIVESLGRLVTAGLITDDQCFSALSRITLTTDRQDAAPRADLVLEAIGGDLESKQVLLEELDSACPREMVILTATRGLQVQSLAARCAHQDRVVGVRWSDPPALMKLVELVPSAQSSSSAIEMAAQFILACSRQVVVCRRDVPGGISTRLALATFLEAVRLIDEGVASVEDVDRVARGMYRHAIGPFEALDSMGLDKAASVATAMAAYYQDDRFMVPPLLDQMVDRGESGRTSGKGFYDYPTN